MSGPGRLSSAPNEPGGAACADPSFGVPPFAPQPPATSAAAATIAVASEAPRRIAPSVAPGRFYSPRWPSKKPSGPHAMLSGTRATMAIESQKRACALLTDAYLLLWVSGFRG